MRLIDAAALVAHLDNDAKCDTIGMGCLNKSDRDYVTRMICNAPTVTLQPAGDAISRAAVLKTIAESPGMNGSTWIDTFKVSTAIGDLPSIPVAAPDVDVVRAEEIVEGIEFMDEHGATYQVDGDEFGQFWTVFGTCPTDSSGAEIERDPGDQLCLPTSMVAAMLTAAESVTWPEGHRRNPTKPKEPTLLEAIADVARLRESLKQIAQMDVGDAGAIAERALSEATND